MELREELPPDWRRILGGRIVALIASVIFSSCGGANAVDVGDLEGINLNSGDAPPGSRLVSEGSRLLTLEDFRGDSRALRDLRLQGWEASSYVLFASPGLGPPDQGRIVRGQVFILSVVSLLETPDDAKRSLRGLVETLRRNASRLRDVTAPPLGAEAVGLRGVYAAETQETESIEFLWRLDRLTFHVYGEGSVSQRLLSQLARTVDSRARRVLSG